MSEWSLGVRSTLDASTSEESAPFAERGPPFSAPAGYKADKKMLNKRLMALEKVMKASHKQWAPGQHRYSSMIAVAPSAQGQGLGGLLVRAVHAMADAERVPCYLECNGTRTRDIYKHLGYEEMAKYTVALDGDDAGHAPFEELFAMVRPVGGQKGAPE